MTDLFMTGATADEVWPLVRDFHYSRRMPPDMTIYHCFAARKSGGLFGDHGEPIAAAVYGHPANSTSPKEALELCRLVRSDAFALPLSGFLAWTIRWLRANKEYPFILSYADSGRGHHGGIYQASGFFYVRETGEYVDGIRNRKTGDFIHGRTLGKRFGTRKKKEIAEKLVGPYADWELAHHKTKYLYIRPLRQKKSSILAQYGWQDLPFPKPSRDPSIGRPAPSGVSCEHTAGVAP